MKTKNNENLTSKEVAKLFHEKFSLIYKDLNDMYFDKNMDYASLSGFLCETNYFSVTFLYGKIEIDSITDEPENLINFIKTLDLKGTVVYSKKIIIEQEETILI